jgi:hypothetical protein
VKLPARDLLPDTAPLFEKERNVVVRTLPVYGFHPFALHRSRAGAGFTAYNYPVDALEDKVFERTNKRFTRQEADMRRNRYKVGDSIYDARILDADAHPDIGRPPQ